MRVLPTLHQWLEHNLSTLDAIIFDIDGVLQVKGSAARGSRRLIEMLRRKNFPFYLLTNDGDHSTEEKADVLNNSGLCVSPDEIVSCADGLAGLFGSLEQQYPDGSSEKKDASDNGHALMGTTNNESPIVTDTSRDFHINRYSKQFLHKLSDTPFFIMGCLGTPCFAQKAGLKTTRNLQKIDICQGIIVGERNYDWEKTINAAVNFFIRYPEAPLIVPNPDEYYPGQNGQLCIGAGGVAGFMVQILKSYGITIEPLYLGKPFSPIFKKTHELLEKKYGKTIPLDRILMVGDYINSDIKGAKDFGCRSAIVLTGVTTIEMLQKSEIIPDMVFEILG
ncbi:MAG: HAD hydrolase-like protein [Desulfamplus sp.]|nr:HAD hydrolase-like protein [Desulfamplus sp.]